jgi:hypothetical protein
MYLFADWENIRWCSWGIARHFVRRARLARADATVIALLQLLGDELDRVLEVVGLEVRDEARCRSAKSGNVHGDSDAPC